MYVIFSESDIMKSVWLTPIELLGLQSMFPNVFGVLHNGGTWFISCIIIAYLVYPYLQELVKSQSTKCRVLLTILMAMLISYLPEIAIKYELGSLYTNPLLRLFEFATGALLASLIGCNLVKECFKNNIVTICIVFISAMTIVYSFYAQIAELQYLNIILLCIALFISVYISCERLDNSRCLQYISGLTYHFYILQLFLWIPSLKIVKWLSIEAWKWNFIVPFFLLIIMCIIVHEIYEKPVKKLLKKAFKL